MISIRRLFSSGRGEPRDRTEPRVRAMRGHDIAEVMRIEAASFPDAWTLEVLDYFLVKRRASGHVIERAGECVGFFIVLRTGDSLHLANMAVAPAERRKGLATLALQSIENIARAHGLARIELEVRESNLAAQLLYRRNGYRAVDILRSYYPDQDAYRMTKDVMPLGPGRRGT
jgi:ribosomal-protein-alanine N-acetyltransferase